MSSELLTKLGNKLHNQEAYSHISFDEPENNIALEGEQLQGKINQIYKKLSELNVKLHEAEMRHTCLDATLSECLKASSRL